MSIYVYYAPCVMHAIIVTFKMPVIQNDISEKYFILNKTYFFSYISWANIHTISVHTVVLTFVCKSRVCEIIYKYLFYHKVACLKLTYYGVP